MAAVLLLAAASCVAAAPFSAQLRPGVTLSWSMSGDSVAMQLTLSGSAAGQWFGFGVNDGASMVGTDSIVFEPGRAAGQQVNQYVLHSKSMSGINMISPSTLTSVSVKSSGGTTTAHFTRPLAAGPYSGARSIPSSGSTTLVFACGAGSGSSHIGRHDDSDAGAGSINFAEGTFDSSGLAGDVIPYAHGIMMATAWGLLIPIGVIAARFGKRVQPTRGPSACWFITHRNIQYAGILMAVIAFGLAVYMTPTGTHFTLPHHILGLVVTILGVLQPLGALIRPAAPKAGGDKTCVRLLWEMGHKMFGYAAVIVAVATNILGINQLELDPMWTSAYVLVVTALGAAFLTCEVHAWCCAPPLDPEDKATGVSNGMMWALMQEESGGLDDSGNTMMVAIN